MCGIYFSLAAASAAYPSDSLLSTLNRRGPDLSQRIVRHLPDRDSSPGLHLVFHSTVLSLRGDRVIEQPVASAETESTLCWNGEAWSIDGRPVDSNDTLQVYLAFTEATTQDSDPTTSPEERLLQRIASITGPFAFVYFDHPTRTLYFGRDATGRRSLMIRERADSFVVSSCSDPDDTDGWTELEPAGVYSIKLDQLAHTGDLKAAPIQWNLHVWEDQAKSSNTIASSRVSQSIPRTNTSLESSSEAFEFDRMHVDKLQTHLLKSLHLRLRGIPAWKYSSAVASKHKQSIDNPSRYTERVAVLFSGGLDCTVLSRLAHDILPLDQPIALLNVAFENPRRAKSGKSVDMQCEECPDRVTARSSLSELQRTCLGRQWLFIAVNVTFDQISSYRNKIVTLMKPQDTEMDLSIAMALYFASRGAGQLATVNGSETYTTVAQVLISGLGADELFGGYIRHETASRRGGLAALVAELQLDIARIGTRNLGRDDRVTADWAREMRYPFLDEDLVRWVTGLPVWQKCRLGIPRDDNANLFDDNIEAGKYLLRVLAWNLGLKRAALEKKRAIQFGSRSAKMFNRKTKGTEAIQAR